MLQTACIREENTETNDFAFYQKKLKGVNEMQN